MANVKFTEFPSAATVGATDIIPIVQGGVNKKATALIFSDYIGSAFVGLTGNQTVAGIKTFSSQLISTVAIGTAPFSVVSTTKVTNLNADLLDGLSSAAFQTVLTNPITGTGTTNYLPKFTGTSALGNSVIYDDGTNVTIGGTNSYGWKTLINAGANAQNLLLASSVSGVYIAFNDLNSGDAPRIGGITNDMVFRTSSAERMRISSAGNVGIGTTSPSRKLVVDGGSADYTPIWAKSSLLASDKYYASIIVGYETNTNQSTQFGYVYDTITPANSFAHITPYGSAEGSVFKVTTTGAATFSGSVKIGSFTTTQINALSASAGMVVFNTTLATLCFYDGSGWRKVSHSAM